VKKKTENILITAELLTGKYICTINNWSRTRNCTNGQQWITASIKHLLFYNK